MTEEKNLKQIDPAETEDLVITESIHLTARESARISHENRRITNAIEKSATGKMFPKANTPL